MVLYKLVEEEKLVNFDGAYCDRIIKDLDNSIQELSGVFITPHALIQA